jgi:hypothetical protein
MEDTHLTRQIQFDFAHEILTLAKLPGQTAYIESTVLKAECGDKICSIEYSEGFDLCPALPGC